MLFAMGITMLRLSVAKAKWRVKLQRAIEGNGQFAPQLANMHLVIEPPSLSKRGK